MKKTALTLVSMALLGGVAFASSLAIPWFVDTSSAADNWPPAANIMTLVYLKNNTDAPVTCEIKYFSSTGDFLGPKPGTPNHTFRDVDASGQLTSTYSNSAAENAKMPDYTGKFYTDAADCPYALDGLNTFVIPAYSTVAFRPAKFATKTDGSLNADWSGGQESSVAKVIPDRPILTATDRANGSITISWTLASDSAYTEVADQAVQGFCASAGPTISYAHLLPPGF